MTTTMTAVQFQALQQKQQDRSATPLTHIALQELASTLPQPISTRRSSNRDTHADSTTFPSRESTGCPSLSSSPTSINSSTTNISLATIPDNFLPSQDLSDRVKDALSKPATHNYSYNEPNYTSFSRYDDGCKTYVPTMGVPKQPEYKPAQIVSTEAPKVRKPIPMTFLPARAMAPPVFTPLPSATIIAPPAPPSTPNVERANPVFLWRPPTAVVPPQSLFPQPAEESQVVVIRTEPELLCPTNADEVTDAFVDTVFGYLSMPHEAIARSFDLELAEGAGISIETVRTDRKAALRGYVEKYVQANPVIRVGEGCW